MRNEEKHFFSHACLEREMFAHVFQVGNEDIASWVVGEKWINLFMCFWTGMKKFVHVFLVGNERQC